MMIVRSAATRHIIFVVPEPGEDFERVWVYLNIRFNVLGCEWVYPGIYVVEVV